MNLNNPQRKLRARPSKSGVPKPLENRDINEQQEISTNDLIQQRSTCAKCGKNVRRLETHLCGQEKEVSCGECGRIFLSDMALRKHEFKAHQKPLKCDICNRKFTKIDYIIRHLKFGHAEKTFTCVICNFATPERNQLRMHMEKRHLKSYTLFCKVCSKGFFDKSSLNQHVNMHTGATPYQCEICGKSFKIKCTLRAHKFRFHAHLFPHVCSVCGRGLSTAEGLSSHMKLHTEDRKLVCDVCGRRLNTSRSLEEHKRLHTGERPYECGLCQKSYPAHKHLVRHIKLVHTREKSEKTLECSLCNKKYSSLSACLSHQKNCLHGLPV